MSANIDVDIDLTLLYHATCHLHSTVTQDNTGSLLSELFSQIVLVGWGSELSTHTHARMYRRHYIICSSDVYSNDTAATHDIVRHYIIYSTTRGDPG